MQFGAFGLWCGNEELNGVPGMNDYWDSRVVTVSLVCLLLKIIL
jgi:hypothetical protein